MNVNEVKDILRNNPSDHFLNEISKDNRKGVIKLLKEYYNKQNKIQYKKKEFENRLFYEKKFWKNGIEYVAGVDEVGRGALAGPVVAAAVILPHNFNIWDVNDSKKLSLKQRIKLNFLIKKNALSIGIGIVDNKTIDKINIYQASILAMKKAILNLTILPQRLIVDAVTVDLNIPQLKLIKGDALSVSVGAASIIAKYYRDNLMIRYNDKYLGYDFSHNVGYPTKKHLNALKICGITPIHRKSFTPVKKFI